MVEMVVVVVMVVGGDADKGTGCGGVCHDDKLVTQQSFLSSSSPSLGLGVNFVFHCTH